jgi:membrane fusion protein, multidrug efflux system
MSMQPIRMAALLAVLLLLQGAVAAAADVPAASAAPALATAVVQRAGAGQTSGFDGVVEAVRQTVLAAQVAGAVIALDVKAGDAVKAGQVLARIDARAADQASAAGDAQVQSARAALDTATKDFERQQQLFKQSYISQAALERAESQFKSTQAQVAAQTAQAGATRTQSGFFVVKAPYAGIVSEVSVTLGDMAMPGRPLLTLYDPGALRVSVAVPQSIALALPANAAIKVQLPGLPAGREWVVPSRVAVLPTVDAATHTIEMRLDLPAPTAGVAPGQFARAWLPSAAPSAERLAVPAAAVVRRAEMTGLYVVGTDGRPLLRQVRLGPLRADSIEILSGVSAGERVALDPQAAARIR